VILKIVISVRVAAWTYCRVYSLLLLYSKEESVGVRGDGPVGEGDDDDNQC